TTVPNRRAWDAHLGLLLAEGEESLTLCIIDLDHFKAYNDEHGHPAGDALLRGMATAWHEQLPPTALLARLGGEEFGLVLPRHDLVDAWAVVEQLRTSVPEGQTCSAGVAQRRYGESASDLMRRADQALYRAKQEGRDRSELAV